MRLLGFCWGIAGVIGILFFAVYRLGRVALEIVDYSLEWPQWLALGLFTLYMAYAEGYKGFHLAFAPRVVLRADYLLKNRRPWLALLAPLFCMGYIHATRKRILTSFGVTTLIIGVVLLVRLMPQPWRGIVDVGVVTGLVLGIVSILFYTVKILGREWTPPMSTDLPES